MQTIQSNCNQRSSFRMDHHGINLMYEDSVSFTMIVLPTSYIDRLFQLYCNFSMILDKQQRFSKFRHELSVLWQWHDIEYSFDWYGRIRFEWPHRVCCRFRWRWSSRKWSSNLFSIAFKFEFKPQQTNNVVYLFLATKFDRSR